MGMIDSDGFLLLQRALMGISFGDISPKVGGDSFYAVPLRYEMVDGSIIFFWHHHWCGEIFLKDLFPSLYVTGACFW